MYVYKFIKYIHTYVSYNLQQFCSSFPSSQSFIPSHSNTTLKFNLVLLRQSAVRKNANHFLNSIVYGLYNDLDTVRMEQKLQLFSQVTH